MNYAVVALDASGSMARHRERVVSSMNEYVKTLPQDSHITVFMFDSHRWLTYFSGPVLSYRHMNLQDYVPDAMTPLYDAVGKAIAHARSLAHEGDRVMLMVDTDGLENHSREYNQAAIKSMVADRQAAGWAFMFMSQGLDQVEADRNAVAGHNLGMATAAASPGGRMANYMRAGGQTVSYFTEGVQPHTEEFTDGGPDVSVLPPDAPVVPDPIQVPAGHQEKSESFFD